MASIVPSILAADFARLGESLDPVQTFGISAIHIDVMDGHFRPLISMGQPVVRSIRKSTHLKLDIHLMTERPERYIKDFVKAGADSVAFHLEATEDASFGLDIARKLGAKAGLALDPATPVEACYEVLDDVDYVLLQTATVGRSSESFIRRSLNKVAVVAKQREARGLNFAIEAEGGIGPSEAEDLLVAGADILVVGSAIFDKQDPGEAMRAFARTLGQDSVSFEREMRSRVH